MTRLAALGLSADILVFLGCLGLVIWLYFARNPLHHGGRFMLRRFVNWFPLGMTYAFLYMGRYNLNVAKNALGTLMTKEDFGFIFAVGTVTYAMAFLVNGPFVDKVGGKRGIIIGAIGAAIANVLMGLTTYLILTGRVQWRLWVVFSVLYALNMYFQSYGAVSIIKVKAYWFHVRERGVFGAIFGTLISFGVYFAFDWGQAIVEATKVHLAGPPTPFQTLLRWMFSPQTRGVDSTWLVFFIPAAILVVWVLIDAWLLRDTPSQAGFEDFDTADASSGEMDKQFTAFGLLARVFTSPIMILVGLTELTSGVLRNGVMQWYTIFAHEVNQPGAQFFVRNWGMLLCMAGIVGGFAAGAISDKWFQSRRGPLAAMLNGFMLVMAVVMAVFLYRSPVVVGIAALMISMAVIGVHSLMSGTAAADFGGRKATATASGITDGFVYLGTGIQSYCVGSMTSHTYTLGGLQLGGWRLWPMFLIPFAMMGVFFGLRMWNALPAATRRYLHDVEHMEAQAEDEEGGLPEIEGEPVPVRVTAD